MIALIDYGLGNLVSIQNMCRRLGIDVVITHDEAVIRSASKIILPGVGNFKKGMENLDQLGLRPLLDELALKERRPVLGICLGAQLMTRHSQEGNVNGLGWVDADTVSFDSDRLNGLKVPHMGWGDIKILQPDPLLADLPVEPRFYFVHTYHFAFSSQAEVTATAVYGYEFACAFRKDNIFGMQYHPEKSHKFGMKVLSNFAAL